MGNSAKYIFPFLHRGKDIRKFSFTNTRADLNLQTFSVMSFVAFLWLSERCVFICSQSGNLFVYSLLITDAPLSKKRYVKWHDKLLEFNLCFMDFINLLVSQLQSNQKILSFRLWNLSCCVYLGLLCLQFSEHVSVYCD